MNKVVKCCFSNKTHSDIQAHIKNVKTNYKTLEELSINLKIHIILEHIEHSVGFIENNQGLELWSEQSEEPIDQEFKNFWKRNKVLYKDDKLHLKYLKKAVAQFSLKLL